MYDSLTAEMYRNGHRDAAKQRERMLFARANTQPSHIKIFIASVTTGTILDTYTLDTSKPQKPQLEYVWRDLGSRGADTSALCIQHEI